MNIGLIAHDAKKKLMQNFYIEEFLISMSFTQQELPEDLLRRLPILQFTNILQDILAVSSSSDHR